MAHAATLDHEDVMQADPVREPGAGVYNEKLGMWVFLGSEVMFFTALIGSYIILRFARPDLFAAPGQVLNIPVTATNTFLLICSSVTMVKALSAIQHGDQAAMRRFLGLTILGGVTFLGMQAYEWTHLIHRGIHLTGNPFGASLFGTTFFCLTGFHGCHVFGGVVYLAATLGRAARRSAGAMVVGLATVVATVAVLYVTSMTLSVIVAVIGAIVVAGIAFGLASMMSEEPSVYTATNNNEVEIVALYWHFVDLVWILVFTFVYLI